MLENEALEEENYDKIFVTLRIYKVKLTLMK